MKYIGDGKPFENEVMYGTCEQINILFKMFALSNHIPKIDPNEQAVYNISPIFSIKSACLLGKLAKLI